MPYRPIGETDHADLKRWLLDLEAEHRDLDQVIAHLEESPPADQLLTRRLKKRKLALKDKILQVEAMLVPDIPA